MPGFDEGWPAPLAPTASKVGPVEGRFAVARPQQLHHEIPDILRWTCDDSLGALWQ